MTTSEPTALRPASELDRTSEEFVWLWDSTHQSWVWMMQEAAWNHWNYRPEQYPVFVMADAIPRPHGEPAVFVPPTCDNEIYLKAESVGREHELGRRLSPEALRAAPQVSERAGPNDDEILLTLSQFVDIDNGEIGFTPDVRDLVKFARALLADPSPAAVRGEGMGDE